MMECGSLTYAPQAPVTPRRCAAGFTLIEILAVVLIIGFVSAMVLPGLRTAGGSGRHDEALNVASHLELARQRAIMTGKPHRVLVDVDRGAYRVEWFTRKDGDDAAGSVGQRRLADWESTSENSLRPPETRRAYFPIPNRFGNDSFLREPYYFDGVETSEGWLDEGLVAIVFSRDGSTDESQIVITDADGFAATLDVLPILDSVRIRHEDVND
jgi:type II secretion system protein H